MTRKFKVLSLNISPEKGTEKTPVETVTVTAAGFKNDAHAGNWHRQISLLDQESVEYFASASDLTIKPGDFGENITTEGIDITLLVPGKVILGPGGLRLEVTQVGKECHGDDCTIFQKVGKCIMPARGVFCRVVSPGILHKNDTLELADTQQQSEN
ncbi:MOSC domain-containing protein [Candidatus Fermentibacteria bacterium]|nr:MAG: MOSC domain-containing protein [Candidatus Fermentibacteria bacterium]